MVRAAVVVLRLQTREPRRRHLVVALLTEAIAFDLDLGAVWVVAVGAGHPGSVHLALGEGAVDEDLALDLPIGMVKVWPKTSR